MSDAEQASHSVVDAPDSAIKDDPAASGSSAPVIVTSEPSQEASSGREQQPLSKKALKRAAKAAFLQEKKLERRQREKAAKKEKKRERRERTGARGELDPGGERDTNGEPARKKMRRGDETRRKKDPFKARVVVDLGFDSYMIDKEIVSLSSQLAYCYSANRKAGRPFESLLFTSLNGRLHARLERENNAGYKRWTGCEWWEEGYERLWGQELPLEDGSNASEGSAQGYEKRSRCSKDSVVYLTADADDELDELKEGETYVLGGIVDHNRHKFLCQNKATAQGIRTARLPIGKYLKELKTRKVLTVNQVFEILVHWVDSRNWEGAIYSVMPKRKFTQQSGNPETKGRQADGNGADAEEADAVSGKEDDASSEGEEENASDLGNVE